MVHYDEDNWPYCIFLGLLFIFNNDDLEEINEEEVLP